MAPTLNRLIIVYIALPIIVIFFLFLGYKILKRSKERISRIFGTFYISSALGNIINMIYAPLDVEIFEPLIIILHVLTLFFIFFGFVFIVISNLIILSSTISFTTKKQNFIIAVDAILLAAMVLFIPFGGIDANLEGYPVWHLYFFVYVISVVTLGIAFPILYTSYKIYQNFTSEILKKRWSYYIVGLIGLMVLLYGIMIANFADIDLIRVINTVYSLTVIIWVLLIYYGIGKQLKK